MPSFSIDSIVDSVLKIDDTSDPNRDLDIQVAVDESADPQLIVEARDKLRPATDNVKVGVCAFYDEMATVDPKTDFLIILANSSMWVGATAAVAEAAEVPCVVIAENLQLVLDNAASTGFPIGHDSVIAREILAQAKLPFGDAVDAVADACCDAVSEAFDVVTKTLPKMVTGRTLTNQSLEMELPRMGTRSVGYDELFDELAEWVMENCPTFRDAFAGAFDFAKLPQVRKIAQRAAFDNAVTGAIPFIKGADFPIMTMAEIQMMVQIERAYGISPDKQTLPEAVLVLAVAFASREFTRMVCRRVPALTWFVKTGMGYIVTLAMGHVINEYVRKGRVFPIERIGKLELNTDQEPTYRTVVAKID